MHSNTYYNVMYTCIGTHCYCNVYTLVCHSDERNVVKYALSECITIMSFFISEHTTRLRKCGSRARRRNRYV